MSESSGKIRTFALTSLFAAIVFLMAFTPVGFINLVFIKATVIHIPVIIGSVILGPRVGALLGFLFGLTSLINNTISPSILSFVFSPLIPVPGLGRGSALALVVCFLPRILVGVVPYYVDRFFRGTAESTKRRYISMFAAGVAGGMTNTLLVMNLIYFLFKDIYAAARGISAEAVYGAILSVIFAHGLPEAIVAGILTATVGRALIASRTRGD